MLFGAVFKRYGIVVILEVDLSKLRGGHCFILPPYCQIINKRSNIDFYEAAVK